MGLCSSGCDSESVPTVNLCHYCIPAAAGRCWTCRAPRAAQPVGLAEWLAPAAPRWRSGAQHTTANAAADLCCCRQTNHCSHGCKQRVAASGREYSIFYHTIRNISVSIFRYHVATCCIAFISHLRIMLYSSHKVLHSMPAMPYSRLHHTF